MLEFLETYFNVIISVISILIIGLAGYKAYLRIETEGAGAMLPFLTFTIIYVILIGFIKYAFWKRDAIATKMVQYEIDSNFIMYWIFIPSLFTVLIINIINATKNR